MDKIDSKDIQAEIEKEIKESEKLKIVNKSYSKDKKGWVTFIHGKRKIKLRKHISNIATAITKYNDFNYKENRLGLLETYEKYGLQGLHDAYLQVLNEAREKAQKKAEEHIELIKNGSKEEKEAILKTFNEKQTKKQNKNKNE